MDNEVLKVELLDEFKGDSVVLVAFNDLGLTILKKAFDLRIDGEESKIDTYGLSIILTESVIDEIIFGEDKITWKITTIMKNLLIEQLNSMEMHNTACHHYLDIQKPVTSLVLSLNEYV